MKAMSQPAAFQFIQDYFSPLTFDAAMDSPSSVEVTLSYPLTGESVVMTGIPCTITLTWNETFALIKNIESRLLELKPSLLAKLDLSRCSK